MTQHHDEISADAARDVKNLQRSGYRGIALLRDPGSGNMLAFRAADRGCTCLAITSFTPESDETHVVVALPGLEIAPDATPNEIFAAVEVAIRRLANWSVH